MMQVIGARVHVIAYSHATNIILDWTIRRESRYICVANVHMLMEAFDSSKFRAIVNNADLTVPDGMPLVWFLILKGQRNQGRVYGPTLMLYVLESAAREGVSVGFYGGNSETLDSLTKRMQARYESLNVAYACSPPYQPLSPEEDAAIVEQINRSGAKILFVGLGCPKQEIWMAEHRGLVNAVMIGVGAAFDFHAGLKRQAPPWVQRIGMEWLFRLLTEPRRLWKRYLYHNPRFVLLAAADLLGLMKRAE